jgi:hypothetical protein
LLVQVDALQCPGVSAADAKRLHQLGHEVATRRLVSLPSLYTNQERSLALVARCRECSLILTPISKTGAAPPWQKPSGAARGAPNSVPAPPRGLSSASLTGVPYRRVAFGLSAPPEHP